MQHNPLATNFAAAVAQSAPRRYRRQSVGFFSTCVPLSSPQRRRSKRTSFLPVDTSQKRQQRRKKLHPRARQTTHCMPRLVRQPPRKFDTSAGTSRRNLNLVQRTQHIEYLRVIFVTPAPSPRPWHSRNLLWLQERHDTWQSATIGQSEG